MKKKHELADPTSCLSKAGDEELIFVLREKDKFSVGAVRAWVAARVRSGKNQMRDPKILEALAWAGEVEWSHWQGKFGSIDDARTVDSLADVRQCMAMCRQYLTDCFPRNEQGQQHFAEAMFGQLLDGLERHITLTQGIAAFKTLEENAKGGGK